ncbi:MAG: hypothetical protein A2Z88_04765 [Omnitrophica WOR_2 bacterium GWA2_47_8]|nr:MAG: hypothetical protein A2Z88_04765 [Omnitrophica WOR_2 bacterium GWA2_47_8]
MLTFLIDLKNRNFLRLFFAQVIAQFGDRIIQMALVGIIAERSPGSAMDLAKLLSFTIIPVFIIGPIAGVYVDRWDRRSVLFICDFLRGLLVLTIPFIFFSKTSFVPIYIIVFLTFCVSRFYVPAKMSIIPDLVDDHHLLMANSLMSTTGMLAFVLGVAMGGFVVDKMGAGMGFVWGAATYFISGLLICSIPKAFHLNINRKKFKEFVQVIKTSLWEEIREGIRYLINHKEIRFIINMLFILLSAAGAVYVVIIVFIQQAFGSVTKDLAVLAICLGIGLFLGALAYGKWGTRFLWYKTIFFCLMLASLVINAFAFVVYRHTDLLSACILAFFLGFCIGPIFIAANTVTHIVSDENMRGKVFTALEVVIHFAFLVAMFISSFLAEYIPRVWILAGVGVILGLVSIINLLVFRSSVPMKVRQGINVKV